MNARVFRLAALAVTLLVPATAQVAILQIRFVEGDGGVHASGRRVTRPLAVEVTDEAGKSVPGAAVSFHLPDDGAGGAFANGMHTDVATTDARGVAVMRAIRVGRSIGAFSIRVVAVKEQARAGAVSSQYVAEPQAGSRVSGGRARWIAIAAIVGGGTAAGVLSATRRSSGATSTPAAPPTPPATASVSIGAPASTVGRP